MQSGLAACSLGFHKVSGHPFLDSVRGQVTVGEAVLMPVQLRHSRWWCLGWAPAWAKRCWHVVLGTLEKPSPSLRGWGQDIGDPSPSPGRTALNAGRFQIPALVMAASSSVEGCSWEHKSVCVNLTLLMPTVQPDTGLVSLPALPWILTTILYRWGPGGPRRWGHMTKASGSGESWIQSWTV